MVHYARLAAADAILALHYLLIPTILLPFVAPAAPWMKYNVLLVCGVLLDWNDGDRQCGLTALESKLRGTWKPGSASDGGDAPAFFQPLVSRIIRPLGWTISHRDAGTLNYVIFLLSLLISFVKLCSVEGISLMPKTKPDWAYMGAFAVFGGSWVANRFV